jgi:hypothetical protein
MQVTAPRRYFRNPHQHMNGFVVLFDVRVAHRKLAITSLRGPNLRHR